ncbi:MAG: hypothetical protein ACM3RX_09580 [Methanococcaceae archaeon]
MRLFWNRGTSGYIFDSFHVYQTAKGDKDGKWTTVVVAIVLDADLGC